MNTHNDNYKNIEKIVTTILSSIADTMKLKLELAAMNVATDIEIDLIIKINLNDKEGGINVNIKKLSTDMKPKQ